MDSTAANKVAETADKIVAIEQNDEDDSYMLPTWAKIFIGTFILLISIAFIGFVGFKIKGFVVNGSDTNPYIIGPSNSTSDPKSADGKKNKPKLSDNDVQTLVNDSLQYQSELKDLLYKIFKEPTVNENYVHYDGVLTEIKNITEKYKTEYYVTGMNELGEIINRLVRIIGIIRFNSNIIFYYKLNDNIEFTTAMQRSLDPIFAIGNTKIDNYRKIKEYLIEDIFGGLISQINENTLKLHLNFASLILLTFPTQIDVYKDFNILDKLSRVGKILRTNSNVEDLQRSTSFKIGSVLDVFIKNPAEDINYTSEDLRRHILDS